MVSRRYSSVPPDICDLCGEYDERCHKCKLHKNPLVDEIIKEAYKEHGKVSFQEVIDRLEEEDV